MSISTSPSGASSSSISPCQTRTQSAILTVSGSNFTNNIKNYKNGDRLVGAVATIGDATISDSYFVNNAGRWGGAITTSGALITGDDVNTLTVVANESYDEFAKNLQTEIEKEDKGIKFGTLEFHSFANIPVKQANGELQYLGE